MSFSFHSISDNEVLYVSLAYHRASIVGWRPCFPCRAFFKHLFCLVIHLLSFRRSVLHSTTAVFLDHISRDWGDVTVVLVELCWTPRRLHISSTAAMDYSYFPEGIAVRTIAVWKNFRSVRRSRCCSSRRSSSAILCWTCWSSASGSSPERRIPCAGGSRTSRSTSWPCFHVLYTGVPLSKAVCQEFCSRRRCSRFHSNSSNRSVGPKMILRRGFVDLVDLIAISIWVQPVAILEFSEPFGRAPPVFSYTPLSQCKLQAVCCRERLHVTVSGKIASLSLWASFKLHENTVFWRRFQVFLYGAILGFVKSRGVSSMPYTSSVQKTGGLPLLRLFPPGINPFLIIEFNSFAFPTW